MLKKTDEQLMFDIQQGNYESFTVLFHRYEKRLSNFAYTFTGNKNLAQDIVQDVFIRVWEHAGKFRIEAKFSSWVYRITTNLCLNAKKKQSRLTSLNVKQEEGFQLVSKEKQPSEHLINTEQGNCLMEALSQITKTQRMALLLAKEQGKSYAEIAEIMGISLSSVESLIYRARKKLLILLKGKIQGL